MSAYRVTTDYEDSTRSEETLTLRTLPRDTLAAQVGLELGSAWHHRSDSGVDYWLRNDATGIYRVASKSDVQAEPSPDKTRRYVLEAPYTVGTQWQSRHLPAQPVDPGRQVSRDDGPQTQRSDLAVGSCRTQGARGLAEGRGGAGQQGRSHPVGGDDPGRGLRCAACQRQARRLEPTAAIA